MKTLGALPFLQKDRSLDHPQLASALARLKGLISARDPSRIAFFIAPTGWGKSHLADCLIRDLESEHRKRLKEDPAFLPAAYVELRLMAGKKQFAWTAFYESLLVALKHPFPKSADLLDARNKLGKVFANRGTLAVLVDEAHHTITACSDDGVRSQAEVIKSLAKDYEVTWIFIGTYDLEPLVRYNGQVARRGRIVHRGRYRNDPVDRKQFLEILRWIDSNMGEYFTFRLVDYADRIFEGCVGLVGILRDWLVDAYKGALSEGEPQVTLEALGEEELDLQSRMRILEEAKDGEREFEITHDLLNDFRTLLAESGGRVREEEPRKKKRTGRRLLGRTRKRFETDPAC